MTALSLLFAMTNAFASHSGCAWSLGEMTESDARRVIERVKLTRERLGAEEDRLEQMFSLMTSLKVVARSQRFQVVRETFDALVEVTTRLATGRDETVRAKVEALAKQYGARFGTAVDPEILLEDLSRQAETFAEPLTLARLIYSGSPSPEHFVRTLLADQRRRGLPISVGGPIEMQVIKIVAQYAQLAGPMSILYLGRGTSAIPVVLSHFSQTPVFSMFQTPPPPPLAQWLRTHRVEPIVGEISRRDTRGLLAARGPFRIVVAQDTLTSAWASPIEVARSLRSLVAPKGLLIIVNDRAQAPAFTREEAIEAGFEIVRWGVAKPLAAEWMNLMPERLRAEGVGNLVTFVLRNGKP